MKNDPIEIVAARALKALIKKNYPSQQAFSDDYCIALRQTQRYLQQINDVRTIQQLAEFFDLDFYAFLSYGNEGK